MKVLVTGGTGFLGKQLALKLRSLGYEVTVLGRNQLIGQQLQQKNLRFLAVDLQDSQATIAACQGQDYIFHCAALSSPWGSDREFYAANVLGTQNIIQGCQIHHVQRLIHVSTSSVYFDFCDRLNIPETSPLPPPVNAYAKTKQLAEQALIQAHHQGLPVLILRPRGIFGPGDTAILPRLIRASQKTGIPLIKQGKSLIDITYIDNLVDALLLGQTAPDSCLGKCFNITNGEPIYLVDLLQKLSQKLSYPLKFKPMAYTTAYWAASALEFIAKTLGQGKEPPLTRYTVGLLSFSQTLDITAATQHLGYRPQISIEQGLDRFAAWWNAQEHNNS